MGTKHRLAALIFAGLFCAAPALLFAAVPVANAGPDMAVIDFDGDGRQMVTLNGSRSTDADNNIQYYIWSDADAGGALIRFGTASIQTTLLTVGTHHLELVVSDTDGSGSDPDPITVIIVPSTAPFFNRPPVAAAIVPSPVFAATMTATVNANASSSFDPDSDPIILYQWHEGATLLSQSTRPVVSFPLTGLGTHLLKLTVHSRDGMNVVKTGTATYNVSVNQVADAPPVASAVVPTQVTADSAQNSQVTVNATASSDTDGHPIVRYVWKEGTAVLSDGNQATTILNLTGLGSHNLALTVYSNNGVSSVPSTAVSYTVSVAGQPTNLPFGGRTFTRISGFDFNFSTPDLENFTGLAYSPVRQSMFLLDSGTLTAPPKIIEMPVSGTQILRSIDISQFPDPQAITWVGGNRFAISLEDPQQLAFIDLPTGVTSVARANAVILQLPASASNVEGLAYNQAENALYFSNQEGPVKIYKAFFNLTTPSLTVVREYDLSASLPRADISDLAFFPRLTPHLIVLSKFKIDDDHREPKVYEVVVADNLSPLVPGQILGEMALNPAQTPQPQGMTFGPDGRMYIVTESEPGPEDHYNIFMPTPPLPANVLPIASAGPATQKVADNDGNGSEPLTFNSSASRDSDGLILDYVWFVNNVEVERGFGPTVPSFTRTFTLGVHSVRLQVRDDNQATVSATVSVEVILPGSSANHPPVADAVVSAQVAAIFPEHTALPVNASASSDPDGDSLTRFVWFDGATVLSDGSNPTTTLTLSGEGLHILTLTVYSIDAQNLTQSSSKNFNVVVDREEHPPVTAPNPPGRPSLNYVHPGSSVQRAEFVFEIVQPGSAEIFIYDQMGREVKNIKTAEFTAGEYREPWDLNNNDGTKVSSGVYFVIIKTPGVTRKDKLVVVR